MTDRPSDVQAWLDDRRQEMAALLEALVRVPTENPPGRELGRCAKVLCDALDRLGFSPCFDVRGAAATAGGYIAVGKASGTNTTIVP